MENISSERGDQPSLGPRWHRFLFRETDVSSLVFLRIALGIVFFWEVWRSFAEGSIRKYWVEPEFHFQYEGFYWIHPLPGEGMFLLWAGLGILAVFICFGFLYRLSALLFFLGYTYSFLVEQTFYQNHYYLICLVTFLMVFVPANAAFSLDAKWGICRRRHFVPAWPRLLLITQVSVVYFFGGIAKLTPDWLQGEPVRMWLQLRSDYPLIGGFLATEFSTYFVTYFGLLFDLALPFLLLSKRTRLPAFVLAVLFHMSNKMLFGIGIFPVLAVVLTTVFFPAGWPRKVFASSWFTKYRTETPPFQIWPKDRTARLARRSVLAFLIAYTAIQWLVPFRHWLYPGNVHWTEEGHRWSWHMKLRDKDVWGNFVVKDPAGRTLRVYTADEIVEPVQVKKAISRPHLTLQLAQRIRSVAEEELQTSDVRVFADLQCALNGRRRQRFIDPEVDLLKVDPYASHSDWIVPLTTPLHPTPRQLSQTANRDWRTLIPVRDER